LGRDPESEYPIVPPSKGDKVPREPDLPIPTGVPPPKVTTSKSVDTSISSVYSGTDIVGRTAGVEKQIESEISISRTFGGVITNSVIIIKKWLGILTHPTRGTSPLGALESVSNFKFNKILNAMSLRDGTTAYATAFATMSSGVTLTTIHNEFTLSTETPSADTIDIICGTDVSSNKHILQRHFWEGTGIADNDNDATYIEWGESQSGDIVKSGTSEFYITSTSRGANYYKGWIVRNNESGRVSPFLYIASSTYAEGANVFTTVGAIPSDWVNTDTVTLYRSFHDNYSFVPTYSTVAGRLPVALQQGNAILFSGGMGSTTGLKPIWSGYLSKTFFTNATNKTGGVVHTGTYVTEAEIKSTNGITLGACSTTGSDDQPDMSGRWFYCLIPETDDGERGNPIYGASHYFDDGAYNFTIPITVDLAQLNKRLRYLNIFVGKATNATDTAIDWNNFYYVDRLDLSGATTTWVWTETATTVAGTYGFTYTMTTAVWNNKKAESLYLHLGHTLCTSTTASFSTGLFINNRLFIGRYYDYVDAVEYLDQVRYTDFAGNGKAQLNVLCNLDGFTQSTIEQGDPTSVQALLKWQDKLFILKDKSCYFISVSDDPAQWMLVTVSDEVGCTIPLTAVSTPYMIIWCQAGENVYGWDGADIFRLAQNQITDFRALTLTGASTLGWFDYKNQTYNFSYGNYFWWSMFLECKIPNGYVWGRNSFNPTALYQIRDISIRSGTIYMLAFCSTDDSYRILSFSSSATTDNTFGIVPYFKTAEFRISERDITKYMKWYLTLNPTGGSGTLDCDLTIGSTTTNYSNISKTATTHFRGVPFTSNAGRSMQFAFNTDASPASFTALDIYELQFDYELKPFIGDNTITT
jgi:hypothetical protein